MKKPTESVSTAVRMVRDDLTGTLRPVGERPFDYELTSVQMHTSIGTLYDCAAGWKTLRVGRRVEHGDHFVELKYSVDGAYPDDSKSTRRLLVLSADGDTQLPREMRRRLCIGPDHADSTVGVQLATGEVVHVAFIGESNPHTLWWAALFEGAVSANSTTRTRVRALSPTRERGNSDRVEVAGAASRQAP